ncbi:hypothetical protein [Flavobacterium davisii]|uniref:Uncharacterized protein n=1 Tax=Flavobacterium columnare TaxID=996 RepID=A0A8G0KY73_9FLAO|nr:hypothetical protein [Flavobacterium davisii]QYS89929.1 hypothetical protein JJC05_07210 [Flavobacterium davisii]
MKIIGDIRPYTNKNYTYTVLDNDGGLMFVILWQVYHQTKLITENGTGILKFGINTAGNTFKLIAKVRNPETNKIEDVTTEIHPLAGMPKIVDFYWRDVNGEKNSRTRNSLLR